jgi:Na+-translocating ferredoxin:NAD+ oxidoreductase RnfE subunit
MCSTKFTEMRAFPLLSFLSLLHTIFSYYPSLVFLSRWLTLWLTNALQWKSFYLATLLVEFLLLSNTVVSVHLRAQKVKKKIIFIIVIATILFAVKKYFRKFKKKIYKKSRINFNGGGN